MSHVLQPYGATEAWVPSYIASPETQGGVAGMSLAKRNLSVLLAHAFVFLAVLYYLTNAGLLLRLAQGAGIAVLLIELTAIDAFSRFAARWLFVVIAAAAVRSVYHSDFMFITTAGYWLAGAGVAMAIWRDRMSPRLLYWMFALLIAYFLLRAAAGETPKTLLPSRSRNHMSVLVLFLAGAIVLVRSHAGMRVPMLPPLAAVLVSLWAAGRAGIISTAFLFLGLIFVRLWKIDRTRTMLGVAAITGVAFTVYRIFGNTALDLWERSTRKFVTIGFVDAARSDVQNAYITSLTPATTILGQDSRFLETLELTLHSSFLNWHFMLGWVAAVLLVATLIALVRLFRVAPVIGIVMGAMLIRASTDTVLLPGLFLDPLFLFALGVGLLPRDVLQARVAEAEHDEEAHEAGDVAEMPEALGTV